MTECRYRVTCRDGCEINADTTDDGWFGKAAAHRRAGFHEGATSHDCEVEIASKTKEYRCPVCHTKCVGERERDDHARTEPGVQTSSFVRV